MGRSVPEVRDKLLGAMFRKLYWVVEEDNGQGFGISGVYTSIPDLIETGLQAPTFRLTLTPLDKRNAPVGTWTTFSELESDLSPLVQNGEIRSEEMTHLVQALQGH